MPDPDPILPPDLERQIFELCALATPVSAPRLMLVAWRVKEWIEPILYRTIISGGLPNAVSGYPAFKTLESLSATIRSKPRDFFRDSVRRLYLFDCEDKDACNEILSICSRVETLWVGYRGVDLAAHEPSTLKHLYTIYLPPLLLSDPTAPSDLFAQLTHLEITGWDLHPSDPQIDAFGRHVAQLPRLTHISLADHNLASAYVCLLLRSPALRVLLSVPAEPYDSEELGSVLRDARFVVCGEEWWWIKEAQLCVRDLDYWGVAERFVEKRLSGKVDRLCYVIPDEEWYDVSGRSQLLL